MGCHMKTIGFSTLITSMSREGRRHGGDIKWVLLPVLVMGWMLKAIMRCHMKTICFSTLIASVSCEGRRYGGDIVDLQEYDEERII